MQPVLKSTYRPKEPAPAAPAPPPLPEGWTEHASPQGIPYYWNASLKKSTYTRPVAEPAPAAPVVVPPIHYNPNAFPGHFQEGHQQHNNRGGHWGRGGHGFQGRRRDHEDRPKHKYAIPGCAPWVLVKTKLGRRFVHNPETNESFWRFPQDVMKGVVEFDRIERERRERRERGEPSDAEEDARAVEEAADAHASHRVVQEEAEGGSDDEYEEVEVTDTEGEEEEEEESAAKKQRTEEQGPLEFNEDDIAWQLQAMEEYGADNSEEEYPDDERWVDDTGGLGEEDSTALFRDMLEDHHISPYVPWETVMENEQILADDRYTVFTSMKSRKEAWSAWSTEKIQSLKEQRERQEKKDPKIPYMAFLQKNATPKLYWPEFKRKYRKEPEMKDMKLSDKDREKWYREHINRLKLPQSTLKSDLTALLKSIPLASLNRSTSMAALPPALLTDIRYISLAPSTRDQLIETWISTLPPALEATEMTAEEEAEAAKRRAERERRERALADREQLVREEKRRQKRDLAYGREQLREEQRELEKAMKVSKEGLRAHLTSLEDESSKADGGTTAAAD